MDNESIPKTRPRQEAVCGRSLRAIFVAVCKHRAPMIRSH